MAMETKDDKLEQLLRMTEHPQDFSDEELDELLEDEEICEFYELMAASRRLFVMEKKPRRRWLSLRWMRYAALIVTAALLTGGLAFAFHYLVRSPKQQEQATTMPRPVVKTTEPIDTLAETVVFQDTRLEDIMRRLGSHYRKTVVFGSNGLRPIRFFIEWKPSQPLQQMVDRLNNFDGMRVSIKGDSIFVNQTDNAAE